MLPCCYAYDRPTLEHPHPDWHVATVCGTVSQLATVSNAPAEKSIPSAQGKGVAVSARDLDEAATPEIQGKHFHKLLTLFRVQGSIAFQLRFTCVCCFSCAGFIEQVCEFP